MSAVVLTPALTIAARGVLRWTRVRLAAKMGISEPPVSNFERFGIARAAFKLNLARQVFEQAGVEFIVENGGGAGVRLRKSLSAPPAAS